MSQQPVQRDVRDVHFWSEQLAEPPCGTLEDRLVWSDAIEDVTCAACVEALTGDGGVLVAPPEDEVLQDEDRPAAP